MGKYVYYEPLRPESRIEYQPGKWAKAMEPFSLEKSKADALIAAVPQVQEVKEVADSEGELKAQAQPAPQDVGGAK